MHTDAAKLMYHFPHGTSQSISLMEFQAFYWVVIKIETRGVKRPILIRLKSSWKKWLGILNFRFFHSHGQEELSVSILLFL